MDNYAPHAYFDKDKYKDDDKTDDYNDETDDDDDDEMCVFACNVCVYKHTHM